MHVTQLKQGITTARIPPFEMKKELLRWDLNSRHTAHEADALTN